MHTQTIYELSQEAERLLMLSLEHLRQLQKLPMTSLDDVALKQGEHSRQVVQPLHYASGNGAGDCRYHESGKIDDD